MEPNEDTINCELYKAVRDGEVEKTKVLLSLEHFYNFPSWKQGQGIILLREAVAGAQYQIAKLLLSKGARVNSLGSPMNDLLHYAVGLTDNLEIMRLLLNKGAKTNSLNCDGWTPLHLAVLNNNEAATRLLLENQANPDAEDPIRNTPLHLAAEHGFVTMAEILLENRAQPNATLLNGYTPLHLACLYAKPEVVSILVRHSADVNADSDRGTPLDLSFREYMVSTVKQRTSIVSTLLESGAKVNAINNSGETILHRAVSRNCKDVVAVTLKYADINAPSFNFYKKCLQTPLQVAIQNGYEELADLLISHGADVNMPCNTALGTNYTPLHLACCLGHLGTVERLLKRGVDLEAKSLEGRTPLHAAISPYCDHKTIVQIVQLMFDSGAKINTVDQENCSILHSAADIGSLPLVHLIFELISKTNIDLKTFVNATSTSGLTPLHIAAGRENVRLVEFLLDHNAKSSADVNALTAHNQTPAHVILSFPDNFFHLHLQKWLPALTVLLENGGDVDCVDKNGDTILNLAVKLRCLVAVRAILRFKPNPNSPENKFALRTAVVTKMKFSYDKSSYFYIKSRDEVFKDNRIIVEVLQEYGLVFNEKDAKENEVLQHAIRNGYTDVVQYLLDHGADFKSLSDFGTPLHNAVIMEQERTVQRLVQLGADVNAKDNSGKMPVYYVTQKLQMLPKDSARVQKCICIAKELLSNGADLSFESKFLELATLRNYSDLVEMALKCKANINVIGMNGRTPLHTAVENRSESLVKLLLDHGANIDAKDDYSRTPLFSATGQMDNILNLLLDRGAQVNVSDGSQWRPLHQAVQCGKVEVIEKLLEYGADIDPITIDRDTPLLLAVRGGCREAAITLLRAGADVKAKRNDGSTSLHFATWHANESIMKDLIYYGADTKARTYCKETPLDISLQRRSPKLLRLLLENGGYSPEMCCSMRKAANYSAKLSEIVHLHFYFLEARNLWPHVNGKELCNCRLWFRTNVKGDLDVEIEKMKTRPIVKGISLYSIITKTKSQMAILARNTSILEALASIHFTQEYPILGKRLKYKWESAVTRQKLLSSGISAFNSLMIGSVLGQINLNNPLRDNLSHARYSWMLDFLNITRGGRNASEMSTSDFVQYLKRIHSLLPDAVVENIIDNLPDNDLRNMISATNPPTVP